ncbi:MAR-binding filament-like protein 1 [Vespa velutina]|uniref:MAR-binding filament-like protein 1 n=1 Tax=Vespa velutina TaxID=202808 RepID=UPI001FB33576|nr:MAR-binding filament-like protein 1 [Vespa velutina]XP_047355929.1 MAR-binding filament-like protein 1 [Vespa velutina]XP_047355939.1 MAR-binding filament-like protein 1 [Vespa velutina]
MDSKYSDAVYTWFERCGIISNIRTHLRKNLVNALKYKDLSLKDYCSKPKPAKQYVFDFLVAEYLFNVNYAYTLSVFASEAPLLIQFDNQIPDSYDDKKQHSRQKLQKDYIYHTLETLGIGPSDPEGQYIMSEYINNDAPLLLCILKCISFCSLDLNKIQSFKKARSMSTKETQTDTFFQPSTDIERLRSIKKKIFRQKQIFDAQLKEKELGLKNRAVIIEEQLISLNGKLEKAQELMYMVTLKEQQLKEKKQKEEQDLFQKEIELSFKHNALLLENERFKKKQDMYKNYERDLEKLQEELAITKKGFSSNYELRDTGIQTSSSNDLGDKNKDVQFNEEKKELVKLLHGQQLKIDELTQYAIQLSRRLEEIHQSRSTLIEDTVIPKKTIYTNTIVSESSSTEDILQDAKLRLKRLEEESIKADRFYYNCIAT